MKKLIYLFILLATSFVYSQAPEGMSYQAVAFNSGGNPVTNGNVGIRISILDNSATGPEVYVETHSATTNAQGLFNLNIGLGNAQTGVFSEINWGVNSKFLKVEVDPNGGTNYTSIGTNQLMSVPYALFAKNSQSLGASGISLSDQVADSQFSNFAFRAASGGTVYAFNDLTGTWIGQAGASSTTNILESNGNFAFRSSSGGTVYAFSKTLGAWVGQTGASSTTNIIVSDGNFAFRSSSGGVVHVFNGREGTWVSQSGASSTTNIIDSSGNFAFRSSSGGTVYAFNSNTNTWVGQSGASSTTSIFESNGNFVFRAASGGTVYAFSKTSGTWIGQSGASSTTNIIISGSN